MKFIDRLNPGTEVLVTTGSKKGKSYRVNHVKKDRVYLSGTDKITRRKSFPNIIRALDSVDISNVIIV